jgi:hypothetical protein
MRRYPKKKPMHVCIYVISRLFTMPGTDTKVTPESDAPIIPKETTYHGD